MSYSGEGETSKNSNKRTLDDDYKNETFGLETLKKVAKSTARKHEFEKTEDDDALPLTCSICRKPFLYPIVTNCNHYFCYHCALKHHEKNNNCFVCNHPTQGVFNTAVEIKELIGEVREKARAMVKEVSTMLAKALAIRKYADGIAAESAEIVEQVEGMMGIVVAHGEQAAADPSSWDALTTLVENMEVAAAKARVIAEKSAEMVKDAYAMTETARAEMAKALVVMKTVKWNR